MPWVLPSLRAPEIGDLGGTWLNSEPLSLADLRGEVVLVDFFDFSCVNCLRTLPYLAAWIERYSTKGLTMIGVHSPEFEFGKDAATVEAALARLGITWPVLMDNDFAVWKRYSNEYWPTSYLVDRRGDLRYYHAGEGQYAETEKAIQNLLHEARPQLRLPEPLPPVRGADQPGAVCYPASPELYLGSGQGHWEGVTPSEGKPRNYALDRYAREGVPTLEGFWWILPQYLAFVGEKGQHGRLRVKYSAKEVNLVMDAGELPEIRVGLYLDGRPLAENQLGRDAEVGTPPFVRVSSSRMYNLVDSPSFGTHVLELVVSHPGWRGYAFTFVSCTPEDEGRELPEPATTAGSSPQR